MIELAVSLLAERASDLLTKEAEFLGDVSGNIKLLQTNLKFMQGFLKDANKRQDEDERVCICVSEIRELAYDAEDVIESFFVDIQSRHQEGFRNTLKKYASIPIDAVKLHKLGKEIEAINSKIINLTSNLQNFKIDTNNASHGSTSTSRIEVQRKMYAHTDEEYTIGLDKDVQILLEKLIDQSKRHQVISICGLGGLGKSTLAKKIYKHNNVLNHFELFAWVFVSQQFQTQQILQEILIQLTSPSPAENEIILKMNDREIAPKLHELQKAKKCLVVIDDLWKKEDWDVLKHAFPIGNIQGTIVITTRNEKLGLNVDPKSFIHEPRTLTDEESWKLFQMKAFPIKDNPYLSEMEKLGVDMVKSCSGLPLAIIVLGGVLATKSSLDEWNSAHKSFGTYLRKGETSEYSTIDAILAVSYSELPYDLKPCFLSLCQFPEDSLIRTRTLFQLWMAEGIVTNQSYEKARGYLRELIDRCLVQTGEIGILGGIKSCRLHDLVRDLTLSLSKANKENFLEIIDAETHRVSADPQISKTRRVLVGVEKKKQIADLTSLQINSHLRTLIGQNCELEASSVGDFKMLRTLRLINCKIRSIKEIGKLIHLKYLSVEGEGGSIDLLPSSLSNLKYLQTFIFDTSAEKLRISKKVFANFQELSYISIKWMTYDGNVDLILGDLTNLQTLRTYGPIRIKNVDNLPNLEKLESRFFEVNALSTLYLESSVSQPESSYSKVLNGLSTLYLENTTSQSELSRGAVEEILLGCAQLQKLCLNGKIGKLPKYHQDFTPKLTKVTLEWFKFEEDPMPLLEKFPNLTFLRLYFSTSSRPRIQMVCSSKGFPRLKTLKLEYLRNLFDWQVNEGSMTNLCHLFINRCFELKMVPDGIKFIKNLSHFEINNMPKEFTDRVGEKGKDYDKIRHVPSIVIKNDSAKMYDASSEEKSWRDSIFC